MLLQDDGVGVSAVTEKQIEIYAGHIYSIEGRVDNQSASVGTKCAGTHITGGPLIRRCLADGCEYARHGCNDAQSAPDIAAPLIVEIVTAATWSSGTSRGGLGS